MGSASCSMPLDRGGSVGRRYRTGRPGSDDSARLDDLPRTHVVDKIDPAAVMPPIAPGAKVILSGLAGAAHLNGASGVLGSFDCARQRWYVELAGGEVKAVRSENIEPVPPS